MPALPLNRVPGLLIHLIRFAKQSGATKRDACACLLGLHGLRISEICQLRCRDINASKATIFVRTLKGGPATTIPIDNRVLPLLKELRKGRNSEPLFKTSSGKPLSPRNLRRRWSTWSKEILGESYRFHDLRHTTAVLCYRSSGNDLFAVQALLRHGRLKNTIHYLQQTRSIPPWLPSTESSG